MRVRFAKINPDAIIPIFKTEGAAAADVYSCDEETVISPGETKLIHLGIKSEFDEDYVALIFARSGLATKNGLAPANKVGVIDADYRGEWMVALYNQSEYPQTIRKGDRIAQVIFTYTLHPAIELVDEKELSDTKRGEGGFGSTNIK
jgi:dUTP pyrophosphatase